MDAAFGYVGDALNGHGLQLYFKWMHTLREGRPLPQQRVSGFYRTWPLVVPTLTILCKLFVLISPPGALSQRQQGGWDQLSRLLVLYPTNDIEISDAQVHGEVQEVGNMWFWCPRGNRWKIIRKEEEWIQRIQLIEGQVNLITSSHCLFSSEQ